MEQSVRTKRHDDEVTLEFGLGESFRDFIQFKEMDEISNNMENIISETIIVTSNNGAQDAITKWGHMVRLFGNLGNVDCPCTAVCEQKRDDNIANMKFNNVLSYSLEDGSMYNFDHSNYQNYDQLIENIIQKFISDQSNEIEIGSLSYGQWWYQRNGENTENNDKCGISRWSELGQERTDVILRLLLIICMTRPLKRVQNAILKMEERVGVVNLPDRKFTENYSDIEVAFKEYVTFQLIVSTVFKDIR